jgi:hypothetical protein
MRRLLVSFFASLTLAIPAFAATGVNLAWDACLGTGGVSNKTFACDTNSGTDYLYVSFVSDTAISDVTGMELKIDGVSCSSEIPTWWHFKNVGACRQFAMSASGAQGIESPGCANLWPPTPAGGIASFNLMLFQDPAPRPTFRMFVIYGVPSAEKFQISPGQETFVARVAITHAKTVGPGACSGCDTPLSIGVHRLDLTRTSALPQVTFSPRRFPGARRLRGRVPRQVRSSRLRRSGTTTPGRTARWNARWPSPPAITPGARSSRSTVEELSMRRLLRCLAALCCLATPSFAAQGVNLRWDGCAADGGVRNKTFACDTDLGSETLVASFMLDSAYSGFNGIEMYMSFQTPTNDVPLSWWQFRYSGACRATALGASAVPTSAQSNCADPWQGIASGGTTMYATNIAFTSGYRLGVIYALPPSAAHDLDPDVETFAVRLTMSHAKTTGPLACVGCDAPVCIGVEQLYLTATPPNSLPAHLTELSPGGSSVSWQGAVNAATWTYHGQVIPRWFRFYSCDAAVPTENRTWGSIKSLYH